jgi:hypothetical protein
MSWYCKWIAIEIMLVYDFGVGVCYYIDWKCLHIKIPFVSIVFNFSGEWAGGYKRP